MASHQLCEPTKIVDLLIDTGMAPSKSQARRLVVQGGVRLDDRKVNSIDTVVEPVDAVLQVGPRRFLRLVLGSVESPSIPSD